MSNRLRCSWGLLVVMLASCGGASLKNAPISCPQVLVQPPTLINPQPNATGVPDQINGIEVTYEGDISIWSAPVLKPANGSAVDGSAFTIVPTPGPITYSSHVPALQAATTYNVDLTSPPSGGTCSETVSIGTFTTH